ncbi:MAG: hypothetical protein H6898_16255 [Rhodobacter sp.]|nr:hypothetical protein [Paracoccaceae bacterium]MCC0078110.1 hypothetical protein [Rhodobacter sp.]
MSVTRLPVLFASLFAILLAVQTSPAWSQPVEQRVWPRILQVESDHTRNCALDDAGRVWCWGDGDPLMLGHDGLWPAAYAVENLAPMSAIATGTNHSCALDGDGAVHCWGQNQNGQRGMPRGPGERLPNRVRMPAATAIAAGFKFTCALQRNGRVSCWGLNDEGQLGDGTVIDRDSPQQVPGLRRIRAISTGDTHACAIDQRDALFCWGANYHGQLGIGTFDDGPLTPVRVQGIGRVQSVSVGGGHTCALNRRGRAFCWGANSHGQLGDGSRTNRNLPTPVQTLGVVQSINAGEFNTCAISPAGRAYCWGNNGHGEVGNRRPSSFPPVTSPVRVRGSQWNWQDASPGYGFTCGLTTDAEVRCWGEGRFGGIGDATLDDRLRPTRTAFFDWIDPDL